jgi:hypothetical protein
MSNSVSSFLNVGYKRAVYVTLILTCITPGILYLYLKDRPFFESLSNIKTIFLGLSVASPVIAFNIALAIGAVYLAFTMKKYKEVKRLKEEVLNRVAFISGILATSLSLNLCVIGLYIIGFEASFWHIVLAFIFDIIIIIVFVLLHKKKVDLDLFNHDFAG